MHTRTHSHTHALIYTHKYIYIYIVEGDRKAPFSIATTLKCKGGCYSFTWIVPLIFNLYLIMLCVKQRGIKYHFWNLRYASTQDWTAISQTIGKHSKHYVIFWPSTQPKNAIPRWYTGRKWHIPMASNRKRSRGRIKAYEVGQGEGSIVPLQWCTGRE